MTYPNGVVHGYTHDTRNRLTNLGVKNATASLESYGYTLDAAGHRTAVTEQSGRTVNYGYDTIYRLTNETIASDPNGMNGSVSDTYDNVENRLQKASTLPGFPDASSTYNANDELTTDQYDADGNTVGSGLNTGTCGYAYNFENRLVQQAGISIVYDGDGNRVSKATANVTTQYLVDDLNPTGYAQVIDEVQSSAVTRTYTWGLDLINKHQTLKLQTQIGHELAPMDRVKVAGGCARSCSPWFFSASRSKTRSRRRSAKPCGYRCDSES